MATIYYHDIGDYLSREQKLKMVHDFRSVKSMEWAEIVPNEKNDWINLRDGLFDSLLAIEPQKKFDFMSNSFFSIGTYGLSSGRDAFIYNFSYTKLTSTVKRMIDFFNEQKNLKDPIVNTTKISWSRGLNRLLSIGVKLKYDNSSMRETMYRAFIKSNGYFNRSLNEYLYSLPQIFGNESLENVAIMVSGKSGKKESLLFITKILPDSNLLDAGAQCFPLYWYEANTHKQKTLFDDTSDDDYIRHDGITDWILKEVRNRYNGAKNITKEMIFYYVYGLLHSKDYRERFAADLKKSLPRIPIVERIEDFMAFYKAGKQLAELHLNYEEVPPHPEVVVHITAKRADQDDYDYFRVDPKMKFRSKDDKSVILYNANIRLENIPLKAYDYIVNGKSAIEWIVERYCVSIDKKSLIKNDANDWAREHGKPRYILDLLLSVINVSTQTVDIVNNLPHLTFD